MSGRSLEGRAAVVTGSSSGIGKGIAAHFAALGARVVVHGRDGERTRAVARAIDAAGGDAAAFVGDLAEPEVCRALIAFAVRRFGRVDVLVNNAGDTRRGNVDSTSVELWDAIMAANLRAPFLCLQAAVKQMRAQGGGSIVNIGSVNAYIGDTKLLPYSVSKGGLMTLTRNAASYLNRDCIRVNQLNVGWTMTEGEHQVQLREGKPENWAEEVTRTRPFGRLLTPADIAYAAAYFASDESAMITGSVLDLEQYPIGAPGSW